MVRSPGSVTESAQPFPARRTKRLTISIRWTLPLLIVTPLVTGIGLTGWLAFRNGQNAVEILVKHLSAEVTSNIEKEVTNYLGRPSVVSEALMSEIRSGNIELNNVEQLSQNFWYWTRSPTLTNNLYYGNEQGEFVYATRETNHSRIDILNASTQFLRVAYKVDASGSLTEKISTTEYDPRERPWYQTAVEQQQAIWSNAYVATSRSELTLTRAIPVFQEGRLQGVLGVDVYLSELSHFLRNLELRPADHILPSSEEARTFIIEPSGDLIATSAPEPPFLKDAQNQLSRLPAINSQDSRVKATAQALMAVKERWLQTTTPYTFDFKINNQKQLVHVYGLQDLGVDWFIVVTIPQAAYMGTINANARQTMMIGLGITGITSLLGLAVALWIVRPIQRINKAAQAIKANAFDATPLQPVMARPDEFGQLAELFNDMAIVVVSREQSLAEQVEALRSEIDQYGPLSPSGLDQQLDLKALLRRSKHLRQAVNKQRSSA
jgi:HAMP domain-containing protein